MLDHCHAGCARTLAALTHLSELNFEASSISRSIAAYMPSLHAWSGPNCDGAEGYSGRIRGGAQVACGAPQSRQRRCCRRTPPRPAPAPTSGSFFTATCRPRQVAS